MNAAIITIDDYIRFPDACILNIKAFRERVSSHFPEITRIVSEESIVDIDYMDAYYTAWIKKEKRGKRVKKRHISRVDNKALADLHNCIYRWFSLPSHDCVYSYKEGLSARACACHHVGSFALFKLDIVDFFPSITRSMIEKAYQDYFTRLWDTHQNKFKRHGLSKKEIGMLGRVIALLCTRSDTRKQQADDAVLPIGIAPASFLSNHILLPIDVELTKLAAQHRLVYNRYSDNLFFSAIEQEHIERDVQEEIKAIVENYSFGEKHPFVINHKKTQYVPRWRHQRVLGIVVNVKLNISKGKEKWLRSALHHLYYDMLALHTDIASRKSDLATAQNAFVKMYRKAQRICGQLSYVHAVAPEKYKKYSAHYHAVKLLLEESTLNLQAYAEEEGRARQEGGYDIR